MMNLTAFKPLFAMILSIAIIVGVSPMASAQMAVDDPEFEKQLLYQRAFEVGLWALGATDSFAVREAVKRDLGGGRIM